MNSVFSPPTVTMVAIIVAVAAHPATAQTGNSPTNEDDEIVVTAEYARGSVVTEVAPVVELGVDDIASYGATSVEELLSALSSQTNSSRGRGTGRPIVLINGQRTSGFREVRDLPPEAIKTVQVFPEEVALQYGYRPDQRVINFILKDDYTGISASVEYGIPTAGGQSRSELEGTVTRISQKSRLNLNLEWENESAITESERDIVQDAAGDLANLGDFRTLVAPSDDVEFNANYSRTFDNGMSLSLNGDYVYSKARGLLGLPSAELSDAGNPFFRYFTQFGALTRDTESHTAQAGATLNGTLSNWRWSLTADFTREQTDTAIDRSGDVSAVQAAIDAGTVDISDTDFGSLLGAPVTEEARAIDQEFTGLATISGGLFDLPSGTVSTVLRVGYAREDLDSRDMIGGVVTNSSFGRDDLSVGINIDIPLADENIDVTEMIGELSINGNLGYNELSDFGGLIEFGFGLNWEPFDGFSISASAIGDEVAPAIASLGNPQIITPDVTIFDFTNNETVLAAITTGGNPALSAERQRDIKLAVNYRPQWLDGMTFLTEYFRNRSTNVTSAFPLLTPEIEAAFPGRVTRDNSGQLIAIDRRPVNYSKVRSEKIRYGFNFSKRFGQRRPAASGRPAAGRAGASRGAPSTPQADQTATTNAAPSKQPETQQSGPRSDQAKPAAGPGRRPGGRGGRGQNRGRWQLSAYHSVLLEDRILIRPGIQELDLLNGSAIGASGSPRHEFELNGGWFYNGLGFRLTGRHQSPTRVDGGLTGTDLRFSDLTTLNLRLFINLDNRGNLTETFKFLKGSRVSFRIDNIFDDIQRVRDPNGMIPLRYQPGFVDPVGRYVEIDFRKRF